MPRKGVLLHPGCYSCCLDRNGRDTIERPQALRWQQVSGRDLLLPVLEDFCQQGLMKSRGSPYSPGTRRSLWVLLASSLPRTRRWGKSKQAAGPAPFQALWRVCCGPACRLSLPNLRSPKLQASFQIQGLRAAFTSSLLPAHSDTCQMGKSPE